VKFFNRKKGPARVEDLEAQIAAVENKRATLAAAREASQKRIAALDAEREALSVSALIDEDATAQKRLHALADEREQLERESKRYGDYDVAIQRLDCEIDSLNHQLGLATKKMKRDRVLAHIEPQVKFDKDVEKKVQDLRIALLASETNRKVIAEALTDFDSGFAGLAASSLKGQKRVLWHSIRVALSDVLPVHENASFTPKELEGMDDPGMQRAREAVFSVPLPDEPLREGERLFVAVTDVEGLKGRDLLEPGDQFVGSPDDPEIQELLNASAITLADLRDDVTETTEELVASN
jgi:hypothetical protein